MHDEPAHEDPQSEDIASAANYRRLAMVFLFLYLLFPILVEHGVRDHSRLLPGAQSLAASYQSIFFLLAFLAFALAFARRAGRDWKPLDRGFGVLLLVAGAIHTWNAVLVKNSHVAGLDVFRPETFAWYRFSLALPAVLCIFAGLLCFRRIAWVAPVLLVLVLTTAWTQRRPFVPDAPQWVNARLRNTFLAAAGPAFPNQFGDALSPEAVAALFNGLDPEARAALRAWIGEGATVALTENGDDRLFLEHLGYGSKTTQGEGSSREVLPKVGGEAKMPSHLVLDASMLIVSVLLYSVWRGYCLRRERGQGASTETPVNERLAG